MTTENKELNSFIKELYDKYEPYALFKSNLDDFKSYESSKIPPLNFGDWFLYQRLDKNGMMSYPKLALFIRHDIADMALEYYCVNYIKTWQQKCNTFIGKDRTYKIYLDSYIDSFNYFHDWDDVIYIFGVWKNKPNKKELRKAYEKTLWYYRTPYEKRLITINSLI